MTGQVETRPLLEVDSLEVIYQRAITAVQGVSLKVREGEITALVGTNGAGKTTILAAIAGFMRADDVQIPNGRILYDGRPILGRRNYQISDLGISLVPEREKVFAPMTVLENLAACRPARSSGAARISVEQLFDLFPRLGERRTAVAGYLSGGERQMLALSMALLNTPRLMLIDEMSLGLAPAVVSQLHEVVRRLKSEFGISFLIVEQNANLALQLADHIYVLENGRVVFDGDGEKLLSHPDFQEFYLGVSSEGERSYQDVKQYRRKRRWFG